MNSFHKVYVMPKDAMMKTLLAAVLLAGIAVATPGTYFIL